MEGGSLFGDVLERQAKAFALGERLAKLHPELAIVETSSHYFGVQAFANDGNCTLAPRPDLYSQIVAQWGPETGFAHVPRIAWLQATWEGAALQVVKLTWEAGYGGENHHYAVMGASRDRCLAFIAAVSQWNHDIRGEILVYSDGCFRKDAKLYRAIRNARFDHLVLAGSLKDQIRDDFTQFLASRATYEEHGIAWKRGALFLGPPGNGKTLCVKALVQMLGIPCIYVQSFKAQYESVQSSIEQVFRRARSTAPCMLVLEDIDSLLTDESRSFFLNELDGFAENTGVLTLATTNHADRLDPAIIDRPSRFDRKYHFQLPDAETRASYVAMWNARLKPTLQLSEDGRERVVEATDGFSFAYIQEVFVSSMMRWIATRDAAGILPIALAQIGELRQQMATAT